ncbi:MAG TPA: hypothetical protein VFB08_20380 [Burkholderiales bacterium]|nr:hypothetical protein [Burkholderiales bacterium]
MHDLSLRGILAGALVVAAGIAASLLLAWLVLASASAPAAGPNGAAPPHISGAVLQTAPHETLEAFLREKRARLESAGPDHIPIEEAMRRLAASKAR